MTIGVVGSRRRAAGVDLMLVRAAVARIYRPGDAFVSGGCPTGADKFAEIIAAELQAPIKVHPAEWATRGRSAGFYRNTFIAQDADVLIACVAPDRTGGTEDTIKKYQKLGKIQLVLC